MAASPDSSCRHGREHIGFPGNDAGPILCAQCGFAVGEWYRHSSGIRVELYYHERRPGPARRQNGGLPRAAVRTPARPGLPARVPGDKIGSHLTVLSVCDAGGQAAAYVCLDKRKDERLFVKEYPPLNIDTDQNERLKRELGILGALRSRHIPRLKDSDFAAHNPWLAMEYCDGNSLAREIRESGPLPAQQVATIGVAMAEALDDLDDAHLVHRDVKPGNVMLSSTGPKLVDLGLVGVVTAAGGASGSGAQGGLVTRLGDVLGTPGYMSPEQEQGEEVTGASDVYSLALTLCEALGVSISRTRSGGHSITVTGSGARKQVLVCLQEILSADLAGERPQAFIVAERLRHISEPTP